ncbi:cysteine desulfurase [Verrucomicrobium sp. GAS474]|uniref:cysteine desulfurase NifS n=1 Tax=Verrucomicrobium sp. GAS474 TaxID=1882831 RepID=UPI000879292A|nr:cysteine desulfurase NifS [Verrucomicrobium sp. GAS474]SDU01674.1 cysteine desulfurase [Verrucomicrobium sp. GAS474]
MNTQAAIYLDNNATTPVAPEVFEAMVPYLTEFYGNPSGLYRVAKEAGAAVTKARESVAKLIGAEAREIVFTSCGTESDNAAIWSALRTTGKKHIVTTQVEHAAVHSFCEHLETLGYTVTWLPVREDGTLDPAEVDAAIHDGTAIVSTMWANNETGVLFPVEEIGKICKARGVLYHIDAIQVPGKVPIDVKQVQCDFLALSGHKLHAPKGVGVLYIRSGTRFSPLLIGGSQEKGRRSGTENVPHIVALGRAAELALENLIDEQTQTRALRDKLENGILSRIPNSHRNGHATERLPNTASVRFDGLEAEGLLLKLNEHQICASAGSACSTGSLEPSHVLSAMGLTPSQARSTIRLSLSHLTTEAEIETVLDLLPRFVAELREPRPAASPAAKA